MQIPEMPFKVLALAPFCSVNNNTLQKNPISVDKYDLDQVLADLELSVYIHLPEELCPSGGMDIRILRIKDFHPDQIIQNCDLLKKLTDARAYVKEAKSQGTPIAKINAEIQNRPGIPLLTPEPEQQTTGKPSDNPIDNILEMVALPDEIASSDVNGQAVQIHHQHTLIKQIDMMIEKIFNHIFSDSVFKSLESVWRGLHFFLHRQSRDRQIKLEIVPISIDTLENTLDNLMPFLVENLPSLIIVDLPFNNTAVCMDQIKKIAEFSETLMVPALSWVTKDFLYLNDWKDISSLPFLPNHLDAAHYAKWRKLEQSAAGRWLSITCNRFPSRYPYGQNNKPRQVDFKENDPSWISPVWGVASLIAESFNQTGWPTRFTDIRNIYLEDLPLNSLEPNTPLAVEVHFTNDRVDQLIRIGVMPLTGIKNKDIAVIPSETTVAGISLAYQLLLSRMTQFMFWCIDHLEKTGDPGDIELKFKNACSMFWQNSGFQLPEDMTITAEKPNDDNKIPLKIAFTPQPGILAVKQKIELMIMV